MTNDQALAQNWNALHAVAPDLLIPVTDTISLRRATAALRELDREMSASDLGPHPLEDLANMVMQRIMAYEGAHAPIPDTDGASTLGLLMDQRGLTQQDLADATGIQRTTVSQFLRRKRPITAGHARKLAAFFGLKAGIFL